MIIELEELYRLRGLYLVIMGFFSLFGFSLIFFGPIIFPFKYLESSTFIIIGILIIVFSIISVIPKLESINNILESSEYMFDLGLTDIKYKKGMLVGKSDNIYIVASYNLPGLLFVKFENFSFVNSKKPKLPKFKLNEVISNPLNGFKYVRTKGVIVIPSPSEDKFIEGNATLVFIKHEDLNQLKNENKLRMDVINKKFEAINNDTEEA